MAYPFELKMPKYGGLYGTPAKKAFSTNIASPTMVDPLTAARWATKPNFGKIITPMSSLVPGGKYERPASGNNEYAASDRFQELGPKALPNLRPALDVLNLALANRSINKIKNTQLARKNMYYATPSLSVRPVTDLPAEVLAAQQDALSQVRSTDASSDPAINLLSKNIAGAQRGKMRNEQIAGRAGHMLTERNRFDEQQRQNQQAAAETENKNLDRAQDFADYKTGVNTAALEAKKDLTTGFISNVGKNMGLGAEFNLEQEAIEDANRRQAYNDELKIAMALPSEAERTIAINEARKNYLQYTGQPKLNYNQAMAKGAEGTFISKLLTGTLRK